MAACWALVGTWSYDELGGIFYKDQQSSGGSHLNEEVDEKFEKEKQARFEEEMEIEE